MKNWLFVVCICFASCKPKSSAPLDEDFKIPSFCDKDTVENIVSNTTPVSYVALTSSTLEAVGYNLIEQSMTQLGHSLIEQKRVIGEIKIRQINLQGTLDNLNSEEYKEEEEKGYN